MADQVFLAVDLGASSGRVVAGRFDGGRLSLEEVHRFENGPVPIGPALYWDVLRLWTEIRRGLTMASQKYGRRIASVGVDTWGVDFALLGRDDQLLGNPRHYRDRHTDGALDRAFQTVPRAEIFSRTGLQFMQFNTLYQLLALREARSPLLDAAESFLMMPDVFHWLLTGIKSNEFTNATTTQFYNPTTRTWARDLLEKFGLPTGLFETIIEPGADLGTLRGEVAEETGLAGVRVIVPATHDTGSAVMAVPAHAVAQEKPDWCYISSGTWALMGVETPRPVISETCLRLNFTNEGGVAGTIRLLKNITGLWLVQECRRHWQSQGQNFTWDELARLAEASPGRRSFIPPDDPSFAAPTDMPAAIRAYCLKTGQSVPQQPGEVIRCAIDSLALRCRQVLLWLEELTGSRLETIHVVGGGAQNKLLCQATADACGRRLLAGPVEATATGNVLVQAVAAGQIGSLAQVREVVRNSFAVDEYLPRDTAAWDDAYGRFVSLM